MLSSDSMQKLDCISYKLYVLPYGFVLSKKWVEDAAFSFDQCEYFQVNRLERFWLKQDSAEEKKFIVEDIFEEKVVNFGDPLNIKSLNKVLLVFIGEFNCFANWKRNGLTYNWKLTKVKNPELSWKVI